jgi:hypothetical protein
MAADVSHPSRLCLVAIGGLGCGGHEDSMFSAEWRCIVGQRQAIISTSTLLVCLCAASAMGHSGGRYWTQVLTRGMENGIIRFIIR